MKFFGRVFRLYCTVCGLLVTPVVLAITLAHSLGVLPVHKIQAVFADGSPAVTVVNPIVTVVEPDQESAPLDHRMWQRRLEEMSDRVEQQSQDAEHSYQGVLQERQRIAEVGGALAEVLSALFSESVESDALISSPQSFVDRLEALRDRRARLPHLVQTVGTMEPKAVATLLARSNQLDDQQATELLGALSPRKAAEVLSEMGRIDPDRGARLIAHLGSNNVELED